MPVDDKYVKKLNDELDKLQHEVDLCNKAKDESNRPKPGQIGWNRNAWHPDCSGPERDRDSVKSELDRARKGEPPDPKFKFPSDSSGPPPFLGPDSQDLYKKIMNRTTPSGQLSYWVRSLVGDAVRQAEEIPGQQVGPSDLLKTQIHQDVTDFLKDKGSTLSSVERDYWATVQQETSQ